MSEERPPDPGSAAREWLDLDASKVMGYLEGDDAWSTEKREESLAALLSKVAKETRADLPPLLMRAKWKLHDWFIDWPVSMAERTPWVGRQIIYWKLGRHRQRRTRPPAGTKP